MNAAETIAAAIEKLEALSTDTSPGPWTASEGYVYSTEPWTTPHGRKGPRSVFMAEGNWVEAYAFEERDAELIVTLHGTIDAQLVILRDALIYLYGPGSRVEHGPLHDLARAILGVES